MLLVFGLLIFSGISMLLPSNLAKRNGKNTLYILGAVAEILIGIGGFVLMAFALLLNNAVALICYAWALRVAAVAMIAFSVLKILRAVMGVPRERKQQAARSAAPKTVMVGNVKVVYGVTTPEVFEGSEYRVVYETLIQEGEIPFMTCELRTAKDNQHIGDLIFEPDEPLAFKTDLRTRPISEIYLEH